MFDEYQVEFNYSIVGEGSLYNKLRQKVKDYGLESKVLLLGKQPTDKTLQLIAQSDVLIAPSKSAQDGDCEGIPNVLKEAMALGLQVISTYHSGIPELVINRETGYLVNESAPTEITKALLEIATDSTKWDERSKKAQEIVINNYSPENMLRKLVEAYHLTLNTQQAFQNTPY